MISLFSSNSVRSNSLRSNSFRSDSLQSDSLRLNPFQSNSFNLKPACSKSFFSFLRLFFIFIFIILPLLFFSNIAAAQSANPFSTDLSGLNNTPNGAVFVIVDGLGSYYLFPELKGETIAGESIQRARLQTLPKIWENGFRISEMIVPVPVTDKGHSVLVTGNPKADPEMVGYTDASFMEVFRQEGFICIGVMQRGDFETMRKKFDIIIYDKSNSVNNMDFTIQENIFYSDSSDFNFDSSQKQKIIREIRSVFESQQQKAASYADTKDTSEKYAGYNRWGLDTAYEALSIMEKYPDQKFIIVINVGAVDSTGHYRGYYAYLDAIERLDKDLDKIYQKCRRNNLFFILTADHGMAFETVDKKSGGHSSAKYSKTKESLHIPFIISGNNIKKSAVHFDAANQEDVAPTLLSLFNIPTAPRYSQGEILPAKELLTLSLQFPTSESVQLYRSDGTETQIFNSLGFNRSNGYDSYSISGLNSGNYILKWNENGSNGNDGNSFGGAFSSNVSYTQTELSLSLEKDMVVDLSEYVKKSSLSFSNNEKTEIGDSRFDFSLKLTKFSGFLLIGIINAIGGAFIFQIYRKNKS